jgi:uncharacterized protein
MPWEVSQAHSKGQVVFRLLVVNTYLGIGILRCAAFSASKKRPLMETGNPSDSVAHFHDKLLKLKDMMRTPKGIEMAQNRHQTMLDFLEAIEQERIDSAW